MKRLHVYVGVADLDETVGFYSTLFGARPTLTKAVEHLGIQVDDGAELAEIYERLKAAPFARASLSPPTGALRTRRLSRARVSARHLMLPIRTIDEMAMRSKRDEIGREEGASTKARDRQ